MVLVEFVEVDAELRTIVLCGRLVGGHDAAGHVEEQGPCGKLRTDYAVDVGHHDAVGRKGGLHVVVAAGGCGDFLAFLGECLDTHGTFHVQLFGRRFRLYADAFVLRAERERKHGETEKEERLDHLHCGKTVCDVMLFYYLPVEMRSV